MIDFKEIELKDKEWMEPLIVASDIGASHQNFTNMFAWSKIFEFRFAKVKNRLVVKGGSDDDPFYLYPAGSGDIKTVIEVMKQDAAECEHSFKVLGVSPENRDEINSVFPGDFKYEEMRDSFDYVYSLDKLVKLSGNKLHAKRNHINYFKKNYAWSFELITTDNFDECLEMNKQWCKDNDCKEDEYLYKEYCAVRRCFDNYWALGLEGGAIRKDGKIIAFTMGEKLNSDTYVIHVEKAFSEIRGAYQMINREYADYIKKTYPQMVYVNREEDMGYEGLRKAKLSYYPDKMAEKYSAKRI